jgi:hypothetical protein
MMVDYENITLADAMQAVQIYNVGSYHGTKNLDLDRRAREQFAEGLGSSFDRILEQIKFIAKDYGGTAGFKSAYSLAEAIALDIYTIRDRYAALIRSAAPLIEAEPTEEVITELYRPFVRPLHGKSNWQAWAAKFWHFLKHDAFPIEDSRVDKFFRLASRPNSPQKYVAFAKRFREFVLNHKAWLQLLREIDGNSSCCDNKLWDKVFYSVGELGQGGAR